MLAALAGSAHASPFERKLPGNMYLEGSRAELAHADVKFS